MTDPNSIDPRENAELVGRRLIGGPENWDPETQEVLREMKKLVEDILPVEDTPVVVDPAELIDRETDLLEEIRSGPSIALLRVRYDGAPAAAIVRVREESEDQFVIEPLALLITQAMFARITPPEGAQ